MHSYTTWSRLRRFMVADIATASTEYAVSLALLAAAVIGVLYTAGPSIESLQASVSQRLTNTVWVASGAGPNDQLTTRSINAN